MIETAITMRARPRCDRCGWVGDWRTSIVGSRSQRMAAARASDAAARQLHEHLTFWHSEPLP